MLSNGVTTNSTAAHVIMASIMPAAVATSDICDAPARSKSMKKVSALLLTPSASTIQPFIPNRGRKLTLAGQLRQAIKGRKPKSTVNHDEVVAFLYNEEDRFTVVRHKTSDGDWIERLCAASPSTPAIRAALKLPYDYDETDGTYLVPHNRGLRKCPSAITPVHIGTAACALHQLHQRGWVHRSISLENLGEDTTELGKSLTLHNFENSARSSGAAARLTDQWMLGLALCAYAGINISHCIDSALPNNKQDKMFQEDRNVNSLFTVCSPKFIEEVSQSIRKILLRGIIGDDFHSRDFDAIKADIGADLINVLDSGTRITLQSMTNEFSLHEIRRKARSQNHPLLKTFDISLKSASNSIVLLGTRPRPGFWCNHWSRDHQRYFLRALIDLFGCEYTLDKFRPSYEGSEDWPTPSASPSAASGDESLSARSSAGLKFLADEPSRKSLSARRSAGLKFLTDEPARNRVLRPVSMIRRPDTAASPTAWNWVKSPTILHTTYEKGLAVHSPETESQYSFGTPPVAADEDSYDYALPYESVSRTICDKGSVSPLVAGISQIAEPKSPTTVSPSLSGAPLTGEPSRIPVEKLFGMFPDLSIQLIGGANSASMPPLSTSSILMSPFTFRRLYPAMAALHQRGYCTVRGPRDMICFDPVSNQHLIRTTEVVAATAEERHREMLLLVSTMLGHLDNAIVKSIEGMDLFKRTLEAHPI